MYAFVLIPEITRTFGVRNTHGRTKLPVIPSDWSFVSEPIHHDAAQMPAVYLRGLSKGPLWFRATEKSIQKDILDETKSVSIQVQHEACPC